MRLPFLSPEWLLGFNRASSPISAAASYPVCLRPSFHFICHFISITWSRQGSSLLRSSISVTSVELNMKSFNLTSEMSETALFIYKSSEHHLSASHAGAGLKTWKIPNGPPGAPARHPPARLVFPQPAPPQGPFTARRPTRWPGVESGMLGSFILVRTKLWGLCPESSLAPRPRASALCHHRVHNIWTLSWATWLLLCTTCPEPPLPCLQGCKPKAAPPVRLLRRILWA